MKNNLYFLTSLIALLFTSETVQAQYYELPSIDSKSDMHISIASVENTEGQTIIDLHICNFTLDSYSFYLAASGSESAFFIEDPVSNKRYAYTGEDGSSSQKNKYVLYRGDCKMVRLYFEKIPSTLKKFNLIEKEKNNRWDFKGVDLRQKNPRDFQYLVGQKLWFSENVKHSINWLLSESYRVKYYAEILSTDKDGKAKIVILSVGMQDPSMASVNYLQHRDTYLQRGKANVGKEHEVDLIGCTIDAWQLGSK